MFKNLLFLLCAITFFTVGCNNISRDIFNNKTAKEKYEAKLQKLAPAKFVAWIAAGKFALENPLPVPAPYIENGVISNLKPDAVGYSFNAKQGQKIQVELAETNNNDFTAYIELWRLEANGEKKRISSADTVSNTLTENVLNPYTYIVLVHPEMNASGTYQLKIQLSPLLSFPIDAAVKSNIGSLWGEPRDGGVRRHEGIDIFALKGSNIVAAADGVIGYIDETNIGGKVVSLRPDGIPISLYHAHLDQQLVRDGQRVKKGDVIGTVGNTGNAKTTPPHLHFGIYASGGAVDPLPFVKAAPTPVYPAQKPLSKTYNLTTKTKL